MRVEEGVVTDMSAISLKYGNIKHYNHIHPKQTIENKILTTHLNTFI
jgi:hypothetical protein